jgi:hypothetical protein
MSGERMSEIKRWRACRYVEKATTRFVPEKVVWPLQERCKRRQELLWQATGSKNKERGGRRPRSGPNTIYRDRQRAAVLLLTFMIYMGLLVFSFLVKLISLCLRKNTISSYSSLFDLQFSHRLSKSGKSHF